MFNDDDGSLRSKRANAGGPESVGDFWRSHKCYYICRGPHLLMTKAVEGESNVICDGCETELVGGRRMQLV